MTDIQERASYQPIRGVSVGPHKRLPITFPEELFEQIKAEAEQRGWTFSHMVRHLCEASIEGIE